MTIVSVMCIQPKRPTKHRRGEGEIFGCPAVSEVSILRDPGMVLRPGGAARILWKAHVFTKQDAFTV